ncbi:MAG: phosphoadenylyl-sulfate reductase [Deltaproteobacteria bacterium]|nr:phosphoadenylyl-sulfate reductase [Deltaproteobacteria bacterium]
MLIDSTLIADLEKFKTPEDLIREVFTRFGKRAAIGTSGQLTGTVMIDMAVRSGIKNPRIFTIDTLRLFPETYELFAALEKKYKIKVEHIQPNTAKVEAMTKEHGEYLFFDSKKKQELCCYLRKVEPNERALETVDVWLTGLRADQSKSRAKTSRFELIKHGPGHEKDQRPILKIAPLVDWTEESLRDYSQKHDVPVHKLLNWKQDGWYYESLGCVICTTPIGPDEPRRAGRWRWFNNLPAESDDDKECGIHQVKKDEI